MDVCVRRRCGMQLPVSLVLCEQRRHILAPAHGLALSTARSQGKRLFSSSLLLDVAFQKI